MPQKTIEEYIECIYQLGGDRKIIHTNEIAECMHIAPASVTEMLQKLGRERYVIYERYRGVRLTDKGSRLASELERRHSALKEFLVALGLDETVADKDACKIEHVVTPDTVQLLVNFVAFLKSCDGKPFWLNSFYKYLRTGNIEECPKELRELCKKYRKGRI